MNKKNSLEDHLIYLKSNLDAITIQESIGSFLLMKAYPLFAELLEKPSESFDDFQLYVRSRRFSLHLPRYLEIQALEVDVEDPKQVIKVLQESSRCLFEQLPFKNKDEYLKWIIELPHSKLTSWQTKILKSFAVLVDREAIAKALLDPDDLVREIALLCEEYGKYEN